MNALQNITENAAARAVKVDHVSTKNPLTMEVIHEQVKLTFANGVEMSIVQGVSAMDTIGGDTAEVWSFWRSGDPITAHPWPCQNILNISDAARVLSEEPNRVADADKVLEAQRRKEMNR